MPITPSPAAQRACDVLQHLAQRPTESFSVSEIARSLDVPRATCDSVLQALAERSFVRRGDDLRYGLGPSCIAVGDAARIANPVLRATSTEAEQLARDLGACTAVSVRSGDKSRVAEVFDFGPPFGSRAQVGQSIPHSPPFGAVYVAWDERDAIAWISRAGDTVGHNQRDRYRRALDEVRRRGYSVTIVTPQQPELAAALETLANEPDAAHARRTRDEVIAALAHSEYLATDLDANTTIRVSHMSAPVFDRAQRAVSSILIVGPDYEIANTELRARGDRLARAAQRATEQAGGHAPPIHAKAPEPS